MVCRKFIIYHYVNILQGDYRTGEIYESRISWREGNIKKLLNIIASGIIFFICAYYIIHYFQWSVVLPLLTHADWKWLPCTVTGTILCFWLFRTMRWFVLLKASDIHIDFYHLYMVCSMSVAFALLTPFQSGEALKVELLKKTGSLERIPGYGIFMTERILDLMVVLLIALSGIIFGASKLLDKKVIFAVIVLMIICFAFIFVIIRHIPPANVIGRFLQPLNQCVRSGKIMATVVILTIGGWLFIVLGWYASLRSISISVNLLDAAAMTAITTLIGIFSFIPLSLGINEVSISSFLVYFKQDIPVAQAGALIIRGYSVITLIMGFVLFIIWKLILRRKMDSDNN
jgi:uncharacterized membrane protein YbhN (UPF0104 family)